MKKRIKQTPPGNESLPELRLTYLTFHWTVGKPYAIKNFNIRFNQNPERVFYGPPNGSLIYTGPTPGSNAIQDNPLQSKQISMEIE